MYPLTLSGNHKHNSKINIKEMIRLILANVKAKKDSQNIYGLARRHYT